MSGLFSTFNVAKRGMAVQQKAIDVTSHNIANANTDGYARQRAIIDTSRPFGMPTMNNVAEPGQIGTGSQVSAIQRVRDSFLDYQIRVETSTSGQFQARDKFLGEIENIFNEPSDTGISSLIGKFYDSWQQLSKQPQSSNARTVVAQQSAALADGLNHTYTQLTKLKENSQSVIKNSVFEVNNLLNQIDQLNQQIIGVKVAGNEPNDLMDKRDLLLDELSGKFNINIDKQNFSGEDVKPLVDVDSFDAATAPPTNSMLVRSLNNTDVRRFSYISSIKDLGGNNYEVTYYKKGDMSDAKNAVTITVQGDAQTFKKLDECRVLWTDSNGLAIKQDGTTIPQYDALGNVVPGSDTINYTELKTFKPLSGEFKGYMTVQQDIDDYVDQINKLAKGIALSVNIVHSGTGDATADTMPFFVNSSTAQYNANHTMANLNGPGGILDTEKDITAANISVNAEIMNDVMKINVSKDATSGETDGSRALSIAQLRDKLIKIQDIGKSVIVRYDMVDPLGDQNKISNGGLEFTSNVNGMKVDNYFKDTIDRLGVQEQEAKRMVKNQDALLAGFNETKEGISGVSLDEEMANLVQFQHAYQANAKIISTVDELLDVVVNGLKR